MASSPAYDPLSPEVMADPFPTYAVLREERPVEHYAGLSVPYYIVLRYDDVRDAEIDTSRYSAGYGSSAMHREPGGMRQDGPEHVKFRMLIQARFSPKSLQRYQARTVQIIDDLIDAMMAKGAPVELYEQFAVPLPARMTAYMLGAADEDYEEMAYLADRLMFYSWTVTKPEVHAELRERVQRWFDRHIDERLALLDAAGITHPGPQHVGVVVPDDLFSDVTCGVVDGRRITRDEMHEMLQTLLIGGIETTAHLITNCVWRLLEDRTRWDAVVADPDRMIPIAIEESLRFDPPGLGLWRTTVREFELHGRVIPAGAKVQMSYGSANRDPRIFSDPDTFRLDRPMSEMRKHLTFGTGPHMCVGQHLSRLEAGLTLRAFFERLPGLRLAGESERIENFGFWGRGKLPLAW